VLSLCRDIWVKRNPETPFLPPRIHKFPLPPANSDPALDEILSGLKRGNYLPAPGGNPSHDLVDGQKLTASVLPPGSNPDDWTLQVLCCPGHTADSISLLFAADRALFTADAVLGQGTAVFEDLSEYLASLHKKYDARDKYDTLYPGHGPIVRDGAKTIRGYIDHRLERDSQVLEVLSTAPPDGSWTTWTITLRVYEGYPESLLVPAAGGIMQHLKKLEKDGKVRYLGGELKEARWELVHYGPRPDPGCAL
jgi:ribonuclease/clavin/mitogillin